MAAYDPDRDFYQLLGLDHLTASSKTIVRQAYLKSARKAHPDRDRANDAATENFQKIQEAYETLSDPSKKTMYDRVMVEWSRQEKMKQARKGGNPGKTTFQWQKPASPAQRPGPHRTSKRQPAERVTKPSWDSDSYW